MKLLRGPLNPNWVTDPGGWAEIILRKRSNYISLQVLCVLGGLLCCGFIQLLMSRLSAAHPLADLPSLWQPYTVTLLFATVLPLVYLRAARALAVRHHLEEQEEPAA